jgi:AP-1 complex subunit beta-1
MIWIIGEYAERIDNADELLDSFLETFMDETSQVQLQLLTAAVKLFLKQPDTTQEMVQKALNLATEESDNPDLRDRGYIYWRLLSSDPEAARAVVLAEKPEIGDDTAAMETSLLDELISQIATLASVYHKPPDAFVIKAIQNVSATNDEDEEEQEEEVPGEIAEELPSSQESSFQTPNKGKHGSVSGDLLDLMNDELPPATGSSSLKGVFETFPVASAKQTFKTPLVSQEVGHGIFISGSLLKSGGKVLLDMDIGNANSTPTQSLAIQFNKNAFGLALAGNPLINLTVPISNGRFASVV